MPAGFPFPSISCSRDLIRGCNAARPTAITHPVAEGALTPKFESPSAILRLCLVSLLLAPLAAAASEWSVLHTEREGAFFEILRNHEDGCLRSVERFYRADLTGDRERPVLLRQRFDQVRGDCQEGPGPATVHVEAIALGESAGATLWAFSETGAAGRVANDMGLYVVSMPGCCGATPTDIHYSLADGARLFASSSNVVTVSTASEMRFIAAEDSVTALPSASSERRPYVGLVHYAGVGRDTVSLLLRHRSIEEDWTAGALDVVHGDEVSREFLFAPQLSGYAIRARFSCRCAADDAWVTIPVIDDVPRPDLADAGSEIVIEHLLR
jgi:hypothetical protein